MRAPLRVVLLAVLSLLLAGCSITVTGLPDEVRADLRVTEAEFWSSHTFEGQSVVCDDRTTYLYFDVWFEGYASEGHVWLEGYESGRVEGAYSFDPGGQKVEGVMTISRYSAPLSISPQAIVVVPDPDVIGHTTLHLSLEGAERTVDLWSDPIPVLDVCG